MGIDTASIKNFFCRSVIRDLCIDDHILPPTVLEEAEDSITELDTIVIDQVLKKVWVSREAKECSKKPAVTELTLLHITWRETVLHHHWLAVTLENFMRAFPLHGMASVIRWIDRVLVEPTVVSRELRVDPHRLRTGDHLFDLGHLLASKVLLRHLDLIFLAVLGHTITFVAIHHLVLIHVIATVGTNWHSIIVLCNK